MTAVVVSTGTVQCGHGGKLTVNSSQTVLKVNGDPVLLIDDLIAVEEIACPSSTPCKQVLPAPPPTGSRVLKVNGEAVVLLSTTGTASPSGVVSVFAAGQERLSESP